MNNLQSNLEPDSRTAQRTPSQLKTIVQVKEGSGEAWKEVTNVTTVSRNGAGFSLQRACVVGRLVTLVMPLDPELRAYDVKEDLYPVMGIVQYCNQGTIEGEKVFHVGVGFVGKQIPESYKEDPTQSYRISGMSKEGLWEITEANVQFKNRKKPRYWMALGVSLSLLHQADKSITKVNAVTQNISAGGISVASTLAASVGDKVKVACRELDFYAVAVVRNRKEIENESPTLHLEFLDTEFPIDKVIAARTAALVV